MLAGKDSISGKGELGLWRRSGSWNVFRLIQSMLSTVAIIWFFTRVSDYDPSFLDALLYEYRAVFEYWCNEKSIILIEDFRYSEYRMQNFMEFHSPFYERLKAGREQLKDAFSHVLASIEAKGSLAGHSSLRACSKSRHVPSSAK